MVPKKLKYRDALYIIADGYEVKTTRSTMPSEDVALKRRMTQREIKWEAQSYLLLGMTGSFEMARGDGQSEEVLREMNMQMARAEKTFGREPFSEPRD